MPDAPEVTVIVPTRDRPTALARCLLALACQENVAIEVLVVDDGTTDRAGLARAMAPHPEARVLDGGGRGPAAARNLGARNARSEIVAFTDDDCEPRPDWARALARRLTQDASVVAGVTVNAREADPFSAASQAITNYLMHHRRQGFAPSNNVGCRRELASAFPFDETYPEAAGEDRDWCLRLQGAGHELEIERSAVVRHRQELGWRGFVRQQLRYGRGAQPLRASGNVAVRSQPDFYFGLVREGFVHGPLVGCLVILSQCLVAAGYMQRRLESCRRPRGPRQRKAGEC